MTFFVMSCNLRARQYIFFLSLYEATSIEIFNLYQICQVISKIANVIRYITLMLESSCNKVVLFLVHTDNVHVLVRFYWQFRHIKLTYSISSFVCWIKNFSNLFHSEFFWYESTRFFLLLGILRNLIRRVPTHSNLYFFLFMIQP